MPGVSQPTVLDEVHRTCRQVCGAYPGVSIDKDAAARFAAGLDAAAVRAAAARPSAAFPLKFESLEEEVTLMALFHLLDFGSGYDHLLRATSRRGAAETIQFGCFSLALSAKRLDGPWMRACTPFGIYSAFGVEAKVEEELQPGITISKPGPLAPFAAALQAAVVEAGHCLERLGSKSLGALIVSHLDGQSQPATAASLVEELADGFPGFQDSALFPLPATAAAPAAAAPPGGGESGGGGEGSESGGGAVRVSFLRKAQALAADLEARFGAEDARFRFADSASISADSGATLPAVLRELGLLTLSAPLEQELERLDYSLPQGPEERALRAAAVAAVDELVAVVAAAAASAPEAAAGGRQLTARQLSAFLLSLVDDEGPQPLLAGKPIRPLRTVGTVAY